MYVSLVVLIIIAAILLTLVVLVQNSKGGGLASGFQSSNQYMGVRKTTDFLEKATWGLAVTVIVLSILAVGIKSSRSNQVVESAIQDVDVSTQIETGKAVPNFGEIPAVQEENSESADKK
ncbi:MAG: preprotein translocase subunit SecG [Paludibacter sp.]|nr:MAG: preprotein translocase subunit SecG [Paludibacter sp.]